MDHTHHHGADHGSHGHDAADLRPMALSATLHCLTGCAIGEVLGLSDRVLVISDGAVVHEGPADSIDEHRVLDLVMEGSAA